MADRTNPTAKRDEATQRVAGEVLSGKSKKNFIARILPFMGPAFIASVAYMDPGNFATNIQGGAKFGFMLLWVIVASNLMAMLIQALSAKLGIATGRNLAELCRERYSRPVVWGMWGISEVVAMATDLAEFLGAAVGFQLLLGVPLFWGGILTAIATFLILGLERHGFRPLEAVITSFVGVIAIAYIVEMVLARPNWLEVGRGAVVPQFQGTDSVVLAAGILGATVMPHVIFLHSALTQGRVVTDDPQQLKKLFRFEVVDILVAMGLAGFVNAAMLIMAKATFFDHKMYDVGTIEEAHKTLVPLLGQASSWVFGISLLASGLASSAVGIMSGQVIMQGFVKKRIPPLIRRGVTMAPSLFVIALGWEPTRVLVLSQVVLSFGLPFAIIPLVQFTRDPKLMGVLTNRKLTTYAAGAVAGLVVFLNLFLVYQTIFGGGN
jgi:manganese transport protein